MWLTNGGSSTLVAALVRTDEGAVKAHQNLTTFLVEKPTGFGEVVPGLTIEEYEIERLMREAPFLLIGEGTSEIQKTIISRGLLKTYALKG